MLRPLIITLLFLLPLNLFSEDITFAKDNGVAKGHYYTSAREFFEESIVLEPDGPCTIKKILVYLSGETAVKDTLWICGFPTSGNLWPTQYIWDYNTIIDPIAYEYDGEPGWKEIDISGYGLRSEGYDKIVIQHRMKPNGPWFTYDSDGISVQYASWVTDPFTPNPNFLNIAGTIFYYPGGDFMIRFVLEYDYPDGKTSLPAPPPVLYNVNSEAGITNTGYASVVDWNKDGWDDIEINGNMFENQGDGTFKNVNSEFDITRGNSAWADFNNDGLLDIFILKGWTNDKLYKNNGDSTFEDVTASSGIVNDHPTMTALWVDYNNDALPDLFLANNRSGDYPDEIYHPDQLWKNNGDGTFTNVRDESGIADGEGSGYDCYGACATDYNKDNYTDIFVANYRLAPDNLHTNNGDGTFTDRGEETGTRGVPTQSASYFGHGMGSEWADFNNDTWPDLCVGNLAHTDSRGAVSNPSLIYVNKGPDNNFEFEELHKSMGLKFFEGNAGVCWLDLDLDGWQDIWHGLYSGGICHLYLNEGAPDYKLKEITWTSGSAVENSWTAVRIDFDNDGDLDIIIHGNLFRNDMKRKGNWIAFRLIGSPENNVPMDAFGSKITVYSGDKTFYRELAGSAAGSRNAQNSYELHFGLGDIESIDRVVINYPNGQQYEINSIEMNMRYTIPYMGTPEKGIVTTALTSPSNYSTGIAQGDRLTWFKNNTDNQTKLIISKNKDLSDPVVEEEITAEEYTLPELDDNTIYYWAVYSGTDGNFNLKSSTWLFVYGTQVPGQPPLLEPENEEDGVSVNTEFSWSAAEYEITNYGKTTYAIEVATDMYFMEDSTAFYETTTGTSLETSRKFGPGTTYYWHVRAINGDVYGEWSDTYSFTTLPLRKRLN